MSSLEVTVAAWLVEQIQEQGKHLYPLSTKDLVEQGAIDDDLLSAALDALENTGQVDGVMLGRLWSMLDGLQKRKWHVSIWWAGVK